MGLLLLAYLAVQYCCCSECWWDYCCWLTWRCSIVVVLSVGVSSEPVSCDVRSTQLALVEVLVGNSGSRLLSNARVGHCGALAVASLKWRR